MEIKLKAQSNKSGYSFSVSPHNIWSTHRKYFSQVIKIKPFDFFSWELLHCSNREMKNSIIMFRVNQVLEMHGLWSFYQYLPVPIFKNPSVPSDIIFLWFKLVIQLHKDFPVTYTFRVATDLPESR